MEEAGVDPVAGLQVVIDDVCQLNKPHQALWPWLQESQDWGDLCTPKCPVPQVHAIQMHTCSRGLLLFRSRSYHSRLPRCSSSQQRQQSGLKGRVMLRGAVDGKAWQASREEGPR